jgi:thiamine-phosphate pyrophosphorylase
MNVRRTGSLVRTARLGDCKKSMRGLYAIVDTGSLNARGVDPVAFAEALLDARPAALQLRDKAGSSKSTLALLRSIAFLARRAGVPFFANDRADLALIAGCDGVHVGQEDLPVSAVRLLAARASGSTREGAPPFRVGVSTHDREQLLAAIADTPDYIAVGPVFGTQSKENASPVVGLVALRARVALVRERAPGTPVIAIGGITRRTAAQVGAVCDAVAVIGALLPPDTGPWFFLAARDRARALSEAILGGGDS